MILDPFTASICNDATSPSRIPVEHKTRTKARVLFAVLGNVGSTASRIRRMSSGVCGDRLFLRGARMGASPEAGLTAIHPML